MRLVFPLSLPFLGVERACLVPQRLHVSAVVCGMNESPVLCSRTVSCKMVIGALNLTFRGTSDLLCG